MENKQSQRIAGQHIVEQYADLLGFGAAGMSVERDMGSEPDAVRAATRADGGTAGARGSEQHTGPIRNIDPVLLRVLADLDTVSGALNAASQLPPHLSNSVAQTIQEHAGRGLSGYQHTGQNIQKHASKRHTRSEGAPGEAGEAGEVGRLGWIRLPATRLGWAALVLLTCLALGGIAYAISPLLGKAFHMEAGLEHIDQNNLGIELNLTQTVDGWTVTLRRAYADANRIVIGYTVSKPGSDVAVGNICSNLTGDGGIQFVPLGDVGYGDATMKDASAEYFDASVLGSAHGGTSPAHVNLHLTCRIYPDLESEVVPQSQSPTPKDTGGEVTTYTFDFSVPVLPGRIAEVNRTAQVAGVDVTLERLVITPSETRAYLRYTPPDRQSKLDWYPVVQVQVNGQIYAQEPLRTGETPEPGTSDPTARSSELIRSARNIGDDRWMYSLFSPLYDKQGDWTVLVQELDGITRDPSQLTPDQDYVRERLTGPWTFKVTVPATP